MRIQTQYDEVSADIDAINNILNEDGTFTGEVTINGIKFVDGLSEDGKTQLDAVLAELTAMQKEIEFTYGITETSTEEQKSVLESYQELAANGLEFTVTANVTDANQAIDDTQTNLSETPETKEIKFTTPGASFAQQAIRSIADELDNLPDSVTVTVTAITTEGGGTSALGNAFAVGNVGLKSAEHNTIVGELGRELVCDPIKGIYYTVGENGTEMIDLPKGAIIYNHKQTEQLLSNGRTSRGKYFGGLTFATGNAHAVDYGIPDYHPNYEASTSFANGIDINQEWDDAVSTLSDAFNDAILSISVLASAIVYIFFDFF